MLESRATDCTHGWPRRWHAPVHGSAKTSQTQSKGGKSNNCWLWYGDATTTTACSFFRVRIGVLALKLGDVLPLTILGGIFLFVGAVAS